ncbi:DUF2911 domain-containing protein [Aequorivita marina]|uniref:DUF2911 domain-containing protein n=1 Tax=Aequorivita marina TaxID=3073654 RepID=UPI002874A322|nr:DUF2911 domain-containing protein [Aequorivita sp. S2608]MDS1299563.1 DUF2911 domain-containing protein [Aequorivita sp. S2608]
MKKIILLFSAFILTVGSQAQIKTPQPSPFQKIEQKVGLTDVTLEYSRPSMKGRAIFGELVPYDAIWRTGANTNTTITFSNDVEIGGKKVSAGSYAIFTKPGVSNWEVYFYNDINNWGAPKKLDNSKIVAQVSVKPAPLTKRFESFTMSFDDLAYDAVTLGMLWDKTYVGVPIKFNTDAAVTSSIKRVMNGPGAGEYYAAAMYYFEAGKDINQAKTWMDKAMELTKEPKFYQLRQKSLIYAKAGDKDGAIKAAKESLRLSKEAKNSDYIALNEKSLKEWGAM